jgi:hypothetical protein
MALAATHLSDTDGVIALEGTLSPEAWEGVVSTDGLGLCPEALPQGGPEHIDNERPVDVRLRLRDGLPTGLQLQHVADHLIRGEGAGADAQGWVLCEALQDVELPEGMEGTAQAGFRTTWGQPNGPSNPLEQVTAEWLERAGAEVDIVEPGLMRVPMDTDGQQWVLLIRVDAEARVVGFYSVFPNLVPEDARYEAAMFLIGQNFDMLFGSFEMDPEDGEVRMRTAWAGGPDELPTDEQLYELVAPHAPLVSAYISTMDKLVEEVLQS